MADPNLSDFYGRLGRIQKAHKKGYGFEAVGTLGRSYYTKQARRRPSFIGPIVVVLLGVIGLKGAIRYSVGSATYDQRVAALQKGDSVERLGAYIMSADPATLFVSARIRELMN